MVYFLVYRVNEGNKIILLELQNRLCSQDLALCPADIMYLVLSYNSKFNTVWNYP